MAEKKKVKDPIKIINEDIKSGEFARLYLFCGEEEYLKRQFLKNLTEALVDPSDSMNYAVFKTDAAKADDIVQTCQSLPFFADRRVCLVDDSGFFKKGNETVEKLLEELPDTTVLIFCEREVDKRTKIYKAADKAGKVLSFETPSEGDLINWIRKLFKDEDVTCDDTAVFTLLSAVGHNMTALRNEVDKLIGYSMETKRISEADVHALCISQAENKIFEMIDAISERNSKKALSLYADLLSLREPMMRILYLITRQYRILEEARFALGTGADKAQIAKLTGVNSYYMGKYISIANRYTEKELIAAFDRCQQADNNIKTGREKDQLAVELLIMDLMGISG